MDKKVEINVDFRYIKYNEKTKKWDVKFLINGKIKWFRGFNSEIEADECTKSYSPKTN